MYRFLLSPKWLLGHALVLAVLLVFPSLGVWQLQRVAEVREDNALLEARLDAPAYPLAEVLAAHPPDGLAYRRVRADGVYLPEAEVLITGRAAQGSPGHGVLTPLRLADGRMLLVERGWVPYELDTPPVAEAAPPDGTVEVVGVLVPGQRAPQGGSGPVQRLTAVDLDRLAGQLDGPLVPAALLLEQQQPPASGDLPIPPALPEPAEGSHLSYAVQWFLFAAIVGGGYPLLVWRTARDRRPAQPQVPELVRGSG